MVFPLNGPGAPGTVTDDLAGTTNFNSITFLSDGWTIAANAGNTIGITSALNDTTNLGGTNTFTANLSFAAAASSVGINVTNPAGTNPNQLNLNGTIDLGSVGLTYTGFGSLNVNGIASDTGGIVANSSGTLTLGAANSYRGATIITSGIVSVTNATGLGTGTVTVANGGTLQMGVTGSANALNLNGLGFGGNGALTTTGNFGYDGAITLQSSSSINVGSNTLTLTGAGGNTTSSISGPGGLTVVGTNAGQLVDQDTGTYAGVTNVLGPTFTLSSPAAGQAGGSNTGTSGYVVSQGGTLALDNGTQQTNNRLGTTAFVELDGGTLNLVGANATTESFGALNLGNAAPGIIGSNTVNLGANNNTVTVGTLNRFPGSTVTFLGTNIGITNTITFGAFGAGAGLVNGILPYADVGTAAPATDFATQNLNGNTGIGIAASLAAPSANGGAGDGTENIKLTAALTLTQDTFVNSLNVNGFAVNLGNFRLIVGSGGLLDTGSSDLFLSGNGTANSQLIFGTTTTPATPAFPANGSLTPVEGIITVAGSGTLVLNTAPIAVGTNLTINANTTGSGGNLEITGTPADSTYTGVTWVTSGALLLADFAAAKVIPTTLVIGDNAGGSNADAVIIFTNFQQLGTAAAPDNVTINSGGQLLLTNQNNPAQSVNQNVGNLTLKSGLNAANVGFSAAINTLTVTGTVTSGGVSLSPTAALPGGLPDVTNFEASTISSPGTLILAPASGTTTVFNVGKTPALQDGGEEDQVISATLGAGSATLDKTGAGVLAISTNPSGAYTGTVQIDGGEFAPAVAGFALPIVVNSSGTLGNDPVAGGTTTGSITVNGGTVNPGLPASPLAPSNSQNALYQNTGTATTPNFSASGILDLHIDGYGNTADWDQFQGTTGANQVTLGGTSILDVDLLGLAQSGTLTAKVVNGVGASPFIWANPLIGKFSNAPNATGNILTAANVLNNPTGFQAIVSYGAGFITVTLTHPPTVPNSAYTTAENTPLTVSTRATGVLANLTDPDFIGAVSQATLDTVQNPGTITGSAGGSLAVNADGTFTYTPVAGFSGTETFTLTAVNPGGGTSTPFTVTMTVTAVAPAFTSAASTTFTVGTAGTFTVTTTGTPTVMTITETGALPAGVAFTNNGNGTATLAGTPADGTGGVYTLTFTASNGVLPNATQTFTLTVDQAPAITSANATTFTVGTAGTFTVTTTGFPTAALTSSGTLPSGVTFVDNGNGTATLSGTPAAGTGGNYSLTFTAANGVLPNATQTFTLTVDQAPAITSANATTFTVGTAGTFTVTTTGFPTAALTSSGTLPSGVTFVDNGSGTATLSGTPAAGTAGTYTLTFTAANGVLPNSTQTFTLTVSNATSAHVFLSAVGAGVGSSQVNVYNADGSLRFTLNPFPGFTGGVHVATGDLTGDGVDDIVVAAGPGGGPRVVVFDGQTQAMVANFFAYDPAFTGGVFVALGDITGDGHLDIVTGAGPGGGPHVKAIDGTKLGQVQSNGEIAGSALLASFYAYEPAFAGGVSVAAGDVNGDGFADIITGAGPGGGPRVEVIDGTKLSQVQSNGEIAPSALLANFFAYQTAFSGGVYVAAGVLSSGGAVQIITGAGPGGGPNVKEFAGTGAELASFFAYNQAFTGGVTVGIVQETAGPALRTGAGLGGGPEVSDFNGVSLALLDTFFAFDPAFMGGVFVS